MWKCISGTRPKGLGLHWQYRNEAKFCFAAKLFRALAFVPVEEVQNCFDALVKSDLYDEQLNEFADDYFRVRFTSTK